MLNSVAFSVEVLSSHEMLYFMLVLVLGLIFLGVQKFMPRGRVLETASHGGDIVAEVLKAHHVEFVFTLVGGHVSPILVSAKKQGIRVIDVRHEVTTVFAADAVARLTGIPGVAIVTAGPGVTNTVNLNLYLKFSFYCFQRFCR